MKKYNQNYEYVTVNCTTSILFLHIFGVVYLLGELKLLCDVIIIPKTEKSPFENPVLFKKQVEPWYPEKSMRKITKLEWTKEYEKLQNQVC